MQELFMSYKLERIYLETNPTNFILKIRQEPNSNLFKYRPMTHDIRKENHFVMLQASALFDMQNSIHSNFTSYELPL